jgi:hypothetical protein
MASLNTYSNTVPKQSLWDKLTKPKMGNSPAQQALTQASSSPWAPSNQQNLSAKGNWSKIFGSRGLQPNQAPKAPDPVGVRSYEARPDGTTKYTYHAPTPAGGSTATKPATPTQPTQAPQQQGQQPLQVGNQMQNAQNVLNASAPNAMAQGAANAGALYNSLGNIAGLQKFSGRNDGLLQSFSDLSRPQSTGNFTGNEALFNTKNAIFQNAANTSAEQLQKGAELQTQGATSVLSAGAPQLGAAGSVPFNPLTQQQGQILGTQGGPGGLFNAGQIQGQLNLGEQFPALQSAHTQSTGIKNTIQQYLQSNPGLNPVNATAINAALQWAQGKQLGDPKYQTLMNYLNEYTATLAPILGVGGDATNLKTEIAQSFVNAQANGQSISDVLNNLDALALGKLEAMQQTGSQPIGGGSSASAGGFAEAW